MHQDTLRPLRRPSYPNDREEGVDIFPDSSRLSGPRPRLSWSGSCQCRTGATPGTARPRHSLPLPPRTACYSPAHSSSLHPGRSCPGSPPPPRIT